MPPHCSCSARFVALLCAISIALLSTGCGTTATGGGGPARTERPSVLAPAEVTEYEGRDLSSVDDLRENSIAGPQYIDRETYRLEITGMVASDTVLSYADVLADFANYEKVVTLNCVEGWSVDILWEGVLVTDLIDAAGPSPDATVAIFRSVDGYSTSLPLDYLRDADILLAYKMNGVELPPERGFPFQLVAQDKWGYKWAKWVTEIEISDDETFRGYWEQRGYSNAGDLDENSRED